MLLRCYELKDSINRFIRYLTRGSADDDLDYSPLTDAFTDDDWGKVSELVDFLQAPYELTKRLEGSMSASGFGSLRQTLPNLQALWVHYNEPSKRAEEGQDRYIVTVISYGKLKLDYYLTQS
ncbi:hypothetical protein BU25DRAFT_456046 [Macroventuria anomochaeta]|uniref:Uncharacterized protein n=1 Tax=Macroventuria anomochaeta TaxID=301207 RepID=A0ACB6S7P1_9PLEO|nr:uncharacterized protein BU25DRAFT_456046 [Macroventuria anomochaeta]KAF2630285.1 hypothetical protein BU25DRAFT_456046 [Macroventuria anomochaeta]